MKNLTVLFILITTLSFGQEVSLKGNKGLFPLYLINGIISNEAQIKSIDQTEVASVSIYKLDNLPEKLHVFNNFVTPGIVDVMLKSRNKDLTTVSFEKLNVKNNLNELNSVYINGILLKDSAVKINESAIFETEIIENSGQKFLNIWTVSKEERNSIYKEIGAMKLNPDLNAFKTNNLR